MSEFKKIAKAGGLEVYEYRHPHILGQIWYFLRYGKSFVVMVNDSKSSIYVYSSDSFRYIDTKKESTRFLEVHELPKPLFAFHNEILSETKESKIAKAVEEFRTIMDLIEGVDELLKDLE